MSIPLDYLEALERFCAAGGGDIDGDTRASIGSWRAGKLAAGAGLAAIEALAAGRGRRRLPGRPPARAPRPGHPADGLLPDQQHRRGRRQPGRAGRARPRPRLGRPPRQRHRSHLLGRPPGALRLDPPVRRLLSGDGRPRRHRRARRPRGRRSTCRSRPAPPATSTSGPSTRSSLRRWRRSTPPGCWSRPATTPTGPTPHRAAPVGRRLRRHRPPGGGLCSAARPARPLPRGWLRPRRPDDVGRGQPGRPARRPLPARSRPPRAGPAQRSSKRRFDAAGQRLNAL